MTAAAPPVMPGGGASPGTKGVGAGVAAGAAASGAPSAGAAATTASDCSGALLEVRTALPESSFVKDEPLLPWRKISQMATRREPTMTAVGTRWMLGAETSPRDRLRELRRELEPPRRGVYEYRRFGKCSTRPARERVGSYAVLFAVCAADHPMDLLAALEPGLTLFSEGPWSLGRVLGGLGDIHRPLRQVQRRVRIDVR